jgi:hypothetical protein
VRPVDTARIPISSRDVAVGGLKVQPDSFRRPGSYSVKRSDTREARILALFKTADAPTPFYHALGAVPSGYVVLGADRAAKVYNTFPLQCTSRVIVLSCDTAGTTADILVR